MFIFYCRLLMGLKLARISHRVESEKNYFMRGRACALAHAISFPGKLSGAL
jgi:hypothetical protein